MKSRIFYLFVLFIFFLSCEKKETIKEKTVTVLESQTLSSAEWSMEQEPITVTASYCDRSEGGIHDFYSEGDYWWPDPENPEGPYIRRDGETNPENFSGHRLAMIRFSKIVGTLAQAYLITNDEKYVEHAFRHIAAWFIDPETRMSPHLLYAQAIRGITTGRGIGIIDTVHLMEVAQGIYVMQRAGNIDNEQVKAAKSWFTEYLQWLRTHPNSIDEMNAKNNHGTCWVMQVASFAKLTGDQETLDFCRSRYKNILLPSQMSADGSFPLELARTKPYGYALFNLDAMTTICQILSSDADNLWDYTTSEGLNIRNGIDFMVPYIKDKNSWPYMQDVMYWEDWPVAHPALIFGAEAYENENYFRLWEKQEHNSQIPEVERNLPIRNPLIWM